MNTTVNLDCVVTIKNFEEKIKAKYKLNTSSDLRISFISGPGDVGGTYNHWLNCEHDPRVPVITYSAMLYEVVAELGCKLQILTENNVDIHPGTENFLFRYVEKPVPLAGFVNYLRSEINYTKHLKQFIDKFQPHILILSTDVSHYVLPMLADDKRQIILTAHNTYWPMNHENKGFKEKIKKLIMKRNLKFIDDAVCTSHECARQIASLTNNRVKGLVEYPNLVGKYEKSKSNTARKLLYLGRIEDSKGIFMLLDAFKCLTKKYSNISLVFAGSGSMDAVLKKCILSSGLDNASFVGRLGSNDVHKAIANSDLLICPTTSDFNEGLALVPFEAAAHGVPSLLSSVVPAIDLMDKGCAVFAADSKEALQEALERLISDDKAYKDLSIEVEKVIPKLYRRDLNWGAILSEVLIR
jgi:glycogen(starch) synthase